VHRLLDSGWRAISHFLRLGRPRAQVLESWSVWHADRVMQIVEFTLQLDLASDHGFVTIEHRAD
jgi:hypothetical protein